MIEAHLLSMLLLLKKPKPAPSSNKKPKTPKKTPKEPKTQEKKKGGERWGKEKLEDLDMFIPLGNNSFDLQGAV